MIRKYHQRNIVSKRSYSSEELAILLNVHIQTVRTWRRKGLKPIEENSLPYLFMGSEIRKFLANEQAKNRVKLADGEFYCLKCRKEVKPKKMAQVDRHIMVGNKHHSIFLEGNCPNCGMKVKRFSTKEHEQNKNPETLFKIPPVTKQEQFNIF